jgi:hypothetical protein
LDRLFLIHAAIFMVSGTVTSMDFAFFSWF